MGQWICTRFKEKLAMAKVQLYKDKVGAWRWRLRATGNNEIIADSAEGYKEKADCKHGLELVKNQAAGATIEE
jgi:uncharacterized protein YegP (UPF0339 family)